MDIKFGIACRSDRTSSNLSNTERLTKHTAIAVDDSVLRHCYRPLQWIVVFVLVRLALSVALPDTEIPVVNQIISIVFIGLISWLVLKAAYVLEDYTISHFRVDEKDNLRARKIHTQLRVLKRIVIIVVCVLALGTILMTFEKVRQLGTTILASAGIIGIVVGMAAQRTIGTFIAGLQIAFTQTIRIDEVVRIENEWGRIKEITLKYGVGKIGD